MTLRFDYRGLSKIISGGQVGVDTAALYEAFEHGVLTGGTAPKGYKVSGGSNQLLRAFGLKESCSSDYPPRTEDNVKDSDATLLIASDPDSAGEVLTLNLCRKHNKPCFMVHVCVKDDESEFFGDLRLHAVAAAKFIKDNQVRILNVAGNRDHCDQSVMFDIACFVMEAIFTELETDNLLVRDTDL